jgi:hypothetical protein
MSMNGIIVAQNGYDMHVFPLLIVISICWNGKYIGCPNIVREMIGHSFPR